MHKAWLRKFKRKKFAHNASCFALLSLDAALVRRGRQQASVRDSATADRPWGHDSEATPPWFTPCFTHRQACQVGPTGGTTPVEDYYIGGYPHHARRLNHTCEDNIASFELVWPNLTVRFSYAFRARFNAGGLPSILDALGVRRSEVDLIICDTCEQDGLHDVSVLRELNMASPVPCHQRPAHQRGAALIDFSAIRQTLEAQMLRDVGHLYSG